MNVMIKTAKTKLTQAKLEFQEFPTPYNKRVFEFLEKELDKLQNSEYKNNHEDKAKRRGSSSKKREG